jgi:hypothetical protein
MNYHVLIELTVGLHDESCKTVKSDYIEPRLNEMLSVLERKDDVKIILLHKIQVDERP